MFWVFSNHHPSSVFEVGRICDLRRKDILSKIKYNERVAGRLTFDLDSKISIWFPVPKYMYLVSCSRLSFEYEGRSLIIAKIKRYCTGKNAPFLSHSDLDLQKIGTFLYGSILFMIMYQYQYVVQPDRLNYGIIGTCLRKGLCISMTDCKGATMGLERK